MGPAKKAVHIFLIIHFKYWSTTTRSLWRLFYSEQLQFSQSCFTAKLLQTSNNCCGPPLDSLYQVQVFLKLRTPVLNTELKISSSRAEQRGRAASLDLIVTLPLIQPRIQLPFVVQVHIADSLLLVPFHYTFRSLMVFILFHTSPWNPQGFLVPSSFWTAFVISVFCSRSTTLFSFCILFSQPTILDLSLQENPSHAGMWCFLPLPISNSFWILWLPSNNSQQTQVVGRRVIASIQRNGSCLSVFVI